MTLEVDASGTPITINTSTGLYTAPAASTVIVTLTANGTDAGSSFVNVTSAAGNTGTGYGGATATWNPSTTGTFSFVMPGSGEVYFYGRHSLGYGGSKSNGSVVNIQNSGQTNNVSFNYDNPLQL